jgi:septum formation protein
MRTLVLASQSPRRKELLESAGFKFIVTSVEISEIPNENLSLERQIEDIALRKAKALVESPKLPKLKDILLLSADTIVVLDGQIIGKPKDLSESEKYLRALSGRTHQVITGLCLWDIQGQGPAVLAHEWSHVTFRKLSEGEIRSYVDSGDGLDKAGAYGIQGVGGTFVSELQGALDNVMGLPVSLVERLLDENGWKIDRRS